MIINNRTNWDSLKTHNVTVRVTPAPKTPCALFRVKNVIDTGVVAPILVLDNLAFPHQTWEQAVNTPLELPKMLGDLKCMYTTRKTQLLFDVRERVDGLYRHPASAKIVPEVLTPGDYLIYRWTGKKSHALQIEALRLLDEKHMANNR